MSSAVRSPNVYTVHNYLYTDADKGLNDLRDCTVFAFSPDKVGQLKVTNAGKTFVVTRESNGKWILTDGTKADADPVKVDQFMDRMHLLKAESIVQDTTADLGKYALNTPNEEVTFLTKDGKVMGVVKLAKIERRNEGQKGQPPYRAARVDYYALSSVSPTTIYQIFEYDYGDLIKTPEQFAAPKPAAQPSAKKN